jgi:hypothetical protein
MLGGSFGAQVPRASSRRREAKRDGTEQGALDATRWQMHADAARVLDNAGGDLQQAQTDCVELGFGERMAFGDRRLRTVCISQNAAVCRLRRT